MINFTDVVPVDSDKTYAHSITERADGLVDIVYEPGELTDTPTELNRNYMMALQGFETSTTVFNSDGSITATYPTGTKETTFNSDGSIAETFLADNGQEITKTTTFNSDGSISEVIS